jgi:hypothetical protein
MRIVSHALAAGRNHIPTAGPALCDFQRDRNIRVDQRGAMRYHLSI